MKVALMISLFFVVLAKFAAAQEKTPMTATALVLIDIQNFYFPGGQSELVEPGTASRNAKKLVERFRDAKALIVHVRHNSEPGGEIHEDVRPIDGEKVVSKDEINAFKNTDLLNTLKKKDIKKLVIAGMMTHMCVEAATRAAHDFDFEVTVIHDACATRALKFGDVEITAKDVHYGTLATLSRYYAEVIDTKTFLNQENTN
jgi:nicotinamidase-related amidase